VKEVCRAGETQACKKIRLTETGAFAGGFTGGVTGSKLGGLVALGVCGVFSVSTAGVGTPVCGIALVGGGALAGGLLGEQIGESTGELLYEKIYD